MVRTNVEWVAQVSLLRPGPPTQGLEVASEKAGGSCLSPGSTLRKSRLWNGMLTVRNRSAARRLLGGAEGRVLHGRESSGRGVQGQPRHRIAEEISGVNIPALRRL